MIDDLDNIISHLGVAISQSIPQDDQIIMDHVRDAQNLAIAVRNELRNALRNAEEAYV
jgi:hypothetical protein